MASWFRKPKYTTLAPPVARGRIPEGLWVKCAKCLETILKKEWEDAFKVCPKCGYHERLSATQRIEQLLDEGSFVEHDMELVSSDPLQFTDSKPYPERIAEMREKTGLNEATIAGMGRIQGHRLSIAVMDMNFIGGSMGVAVGEKIARTMERGLSENVPVVLVCCSGGARMQEGILSLMQMAKTCAVAARLNAAKLPLITILADPTTGGVTASFALLGDIVIAEPQALVGFAGQRVIEATIRQILPPGFQRSEFLTDHGFVDLICKRCDLRTTLGTLLSFLLFSRRKVTKAKSAALRAAQVLTERHSPEPASVAS